MAAEFIILDAIQQYGRSEFLDYLMVGLTTLGDKGGIWIIMTCLLLIYPKTRKTGLVVAVSLIIEWLCCNVLLKPLVARIRPCDVNTAVQLLIAHPMDFSFPSGHTASSFAAMSALFFCRKTYWRAACLLAVLIGFSRMYLYVHYPTDVAAGAVLGVLAGRYAYSAVAWVLAKRKR